MTDQEFIATWDADHRSAARITFVAGLVVALGAAVWLALMDPVASPLILGGRATSGFQIVLLAGILMLTDVALLEFVVGLAYTFTRGLSLGLVLTVGVATLATGVAGLLHLMWGYAVSFEVDLPADFVHFTTWLGINLWMLPLYGLLVGATLLAVALALHHSELRFARLLGRGAAVVGAILCVLAPFTGFGDAGSAGGPQDDSAFVSVAMILLTLVGVVALLVAALVKLGMLLWGKRAAAPASQPPANVS